MPLSTEPLGSTSKARSVSLRLDNIERAAKKQKQRRDDFTTAQRTIQQGYTGLTTVSHFTCAPLGSRLLFTKTKITIQAPRVAPPVLTMPPADAPWYFEEITAPIDQHGGFSFIAKDLPAAPKPATNLVRRWPGVRYEHCN
jgi:hypothetical protein